MPGIGGAIKTLIFASSFPVRPINFPVQASRNFAFNALKALGYFQGNRRKRGKFPQFPCYFPDKQGSSGEHG
jgi:hypothetical protein